MRNRCFSTGAIIIGITAVAIIVSSKSVLAQNTQLLGSARTVLLQSDVIYNKDRKFLSNAIPFSYVYRSGLLKSFREVSSNPDIIVKFHKDVFLIGEETVSITVFDAEDNSVIFSEERKLVDEENDVNKLVAHFLARVRIERDARAAKLAAANAKSPAQFGPDLSAKGDGEIIVSIYSSSEFLRQAVVEAYGTKPNQNHVVLRAVQTEDEADVVLTEKTRKGIPTLILMSRDTKEILHTEAVSAKSVKRGVELMAKWIDSTPWE